MAAVAGEPPEFIVEFDAAAVKLFDVDRALAAAATAPNPAGLRALYDAVLALLRP